MKKALLLVPVALLFLAVSCPQNEPIPSRPDQLPPITYTGENTFGCLVNGKVWLPGGGGGIIAINPQLYKGVFTLGAEKTESDASNHPITKQLLNWAIQPLNDTGMYFIKHKDLSSGIGFADQVNKCTYFYNDIDSGKNWVHITKLDKVNLIICGTFNLFFAAQGCDTLRITKGRFDTKYSY